MAAAVASRLHVDSDLRRLLPRDHEVVQQLENLERTFGSTGSVNVVVKGGTIEQRHAYTDALAAELEGHELLTGVDYRLPSDFFSSNALYYLSEDEIDDLQERIDAWLHYESCSRGEHCLTEGDPKALDKLEAFVDQKEKEGHERTGFVDRYEREGIDANVMLLHPTEPAASLEFAKAVTDDVRSVVTEVQQRDGELWSGSGMTTNVVGPYINKADEHVVIKRDVFRAGAFALTGVLLVLYALFRSGRAVLILLVPLACGVTWALAATQLVLGHLNLMTSMIATVVMGAGIDAGLHFFVRARRERRDHENGEAIRRAFRGLVVPLLVASSTTIGAFAVMATSELPGFREFGVIAAMGVALCLLAMVTVLPALAFLVQIKRQPPARRRTTAPARAVLARPGWVLAIVGALTALTVVGARNIAFEYDGRALQSDHTRDNCEADVKLISEIFGRDIHAGILVRDDLEATRASLDRARARHEELQAEGKSVVAELFAVPDLLPDPAIDLDERQGRIEELFEEETIEKLEEIAEGKAAAREDEGERKLTREDAKMLLRMLDAEPFGVEQLPKELLNRLRTRDGGYAIFAYPDFDAADMRMGVEFTKETSSYLAEGDGGMFVGETTVYAAMFQMLRAEAPRVLGFAAVLVALLVFWQVRSVPQTLMTLLPLVLALWWLVGVMGTIDLRFTLFNLPILPAILGIGVDNGVYLTDRIRRSRGEVDGLLRSLEETGGAIIAAMATTAIGFAAFMVGDSAGVRGIGAIAVLGIIFAAVAATVVLPALSGVARARGR